MIYTEEDAKAIWCPMNHFSSQNNQNCCKGSKCAAWRWKTKQTNFKPTGYCGLAGAVETAVVIKE